MIHFFNTRVQEMRRQLAEVEEGVKRAILATNLGIELKPAQVGLKVQGRELKLAWAQLLATLAPCPHKGQ